MIQFDEYGDKANPTLLMLHGAAATDTFASQYCFSEYYHLVVPHLYGSGREVEQPYRPEPQLAALVELIETLGPEKLYLMGHSLGGELAVALAARYPQYFKKAVFLSAWVCPTEKSINQYVGLAKYTSMTLKWKWLVKLQGKYWHYTDAQAQFMADYAAKITPEQYAAWFNYRLRLDDSPQYADVTLPMLAICGSQEVQEMKDSLAELGRRNPHCRTLILPGVNHDFPMRSAQQLNPILLDFLRNGE